jgi:hypothetical protein
VVKSKGAVVSEAPADLIEQLYVSTGINRDWLANAWRLIAVDDCSGVIAVELERLKKEELKRASKQGLGPEKLQWNASAEKAEVVERAFQLYGSKVVMPRIIEAVKIACWKGLVRHVNDHGHLDHKHSDIMKAQEELSKRIGRHPIQAYKYSRGITSPSGDDVLAGLYLAIRKKRVDLSEYSSRVEILKSAALRTVALIRGVEMADVEKPEKDPPWERNHPDIAFRLPTTEDLSAVFELLVREDAGVLLVKTGDESTGSVRPSKKHKLDLLNRVGTAHHVKFPRGSIACPDDLVVAVQKWAMPFTL